MSEIEDEKFADEVEASHVDNERYPEYKLA